MDYQDIHAARQEAQRAVEIADAAVKDAAKLCVHRLRIAYVNERVLCELKRELQDFNMSTGKWKKRS